MGDQHQSPLIPEHFPPKEEPSPTALSAHSSALGNHSRLLPLASPLLNSRAFHTCLPCLASLPSQSVFWAHPRCGMSQHSVPFDGWIALHCMPRPHVVCPFICGQTGGSFMDFHIQSDFSKYSTKMLLFVGTEFSGSSLDLAPEAPHPRLRWRGTGFRREGRE